MSIKNDLIDKFGREIKPHLESGFDNYNRGSEEAFIHDILNTLDNIVIKAGGQHLHTKTKNIHGHPQAKFDTNNPSHSMIDSSIIDQIEDKTPEIADLLVILNIYEGGMVKSRRAFFSQAKCVRKVKTGYQYWKIDSTQYYFLRAQPSFSLNYKGSKQTFDLSDIRSSVFNYSFVGNVHRPFFYRPGNMTEYFRSMSNHQRFVYGTNPVMGFRLLISILKNLLHGNFGQEFDDNSTLYNLISEIYTHATLNDSSSTQALPDGGNVAQRNDSGMGIVEINVGVEGSSDEDFPPDPTGDLRIESI